MEINTPPPGDRLDLKLNQDCFCIEIDDAALWAAIPEGGAALRQGREHLFATGPVFVAREDLAAMTETLAAIEAAVALPAYREEVLARAPEIARATPGPRGVFMGYDFHLGPDGPRLIEVNTNAGGAFVNAMLGRAQLACCAEVAEAIDPTPFERFEDRVWEMFLAEWRSQGRTGQPRRIAIVDEAPTAQFLYPEFLLARRLFRERGVAADIAAPEALTFAQGQLRLDGEQVDLVYNRLTDFALEAPASRALRTAYATGAAVVTPAPWHHALYADKRNLVRLSDPQTLAAWGLAPVHAAALARVPRTVRVTPEAADALWAGRRGLFFKPAGGYGGKAVYRGDKLTRGTWAEILAGDYIAQTLAPPSERKVRIDGEPQARKMDIRLYAYAGEVLLAAARVYQGQTTNFRTPGGGFAPVIAI